MLFRAAEVESHKIAGFTTPSFSPKGAQKLFPLFHIMFDIL